MTNEATRTFLYAGHAVFTITSLKTGQSFTYKLTVPRDPSSGEEGPLFAAVLTGPDNTRDYTYIGLVSGYNTRKVLLKCTKGSKIFGDAPSYKALVWFLNNVGSPLVQFRHEGRCGRCGRALTVPSSIDSGLGPECAGRV